MNKKRQTGTEVKKLGGVLRIVPGNDGSYKGNKQGCMFDGFEGVILIHCWDTDEWALIEGFRQLDEYRTKQLAIVSDQKIFADANTVQEVIRKIKEESRKIMDKYPKFAMGYPEVAVDTAVVEYVELLERFAV